MTELLKNMIRNKYLYKKKEYVELFEFQDGIMERYGINSLIKFENGFYTLSQKDYNIKLYVGTSYDVRK